MSTQTVTTTTCDSCGKVKPDLGPNMVDAHWAHLRLWSDTRIVEVDACSTDCGGNLTAALMRGEIGEETVVAIGDSTAQQIVVDPDERILPARFVNRCPVGAANASECWDTLPKKQICLKHGTPANRES